jgi:mannose-6-phosphate isomerase-like protein (cupin superfamily)
MRIDMKILVVIGACLFSLIGKSQEVINVEKFEAGNRPVVTNNLFSDSLVSSFCIIIKSEVRSHKHLNHSEHLIVQEGEALMKLNDKEFNIKEGDVIFIPKGSTHSVLVKGKKPLKVISIQTPMFKGDDRVMME